MIPRMEKIQNLLNEKLKSIPKKTNKTTNLLTVMNKFLKREAEWKVS